MGKMRRIKPVPVETEDERKTRIEKEIKTKQDKQKKDSDRIIFTYGAKVSHDWSQSWTVSATGGLQPTLNHCKKCGLNYWMFVSNPVHCEKKEKE